MEDSDMAWYKNTSLWSVLIASVAIVLSQLPPIITWVPRPKIEVQHTDRIGINNAIGIIGYNLNVELRNIGNTDIQIEKMILEISRPDGKVISYPAENFTRISTGNTVPVALPITSISIPRNGAWSEMVFFNRQVSTQDEELFLKIRQDIAQSIFDKQQKEGERFDIRASIPADDDVVEAAMNFFTENFDLEKGNYIRDILIRRLTFIAGNGNTHLIFRKRQLTITCCKQQHKQQQ